MNKFLLLKPAAGFAKLLAGKHHFCTAVITPSAQDLYGVLGVAKSSSQSDIKRAYYGLSLKYHPDKNMGDEEAARRFRDVSEAYEILGNTFLRQKYDMNIPLHTIRGHKPPGDVDVRELKYHKFFESRLATVDFAASDMPRGAKKRFDDEYFDSAKRYRKKTVSENPYPDINDPYRRMVTIMVFLLLVIVKFISPEIIETAEKATGYKIGFFV